MGFRSIFGKAFAKHCHFSLTEVTVIRKNYSFLIVDKRGKVVCEVHFGTKQTIEFLEFWPLPLKQ